MFTAVMQFSCYNYHSNRSDFIVTFVKKDSMFSISIDLDMGNEYVVVINITEDKLKTIPVLWYCYITSLLLTQDTTKLSEDEGDMVIYIRTVWKNLYITKDYQRTYHIDISNISFIPSSDGHIEENMMLIESITKIHEDLFDNLMEEKMQNAEDVLLRCEMTVGKVSALNKMIPKNFPTDLYNMLFTQIV
jgi:hypothetical protein